ncbi:amino acid ABC transporter ATP-binding protein [Romboutsia sp. MSSM.1001216sp_RTP31141st1_G3_RTP31141_220114]|uniref:amino acid ABC transporter ATP-binding protein n=1 Tax=unclassified Romboutsia TaxID=2626894 RepID=UPI0031B5876D
MLEIKNLNKSFGKNKILNNISFNINKGEIGVLLGKSGAGKTTLLRCICGLEDFDSGSIVIDKTTMKSSMDILKLKGQIGMVFQNFNLFPHMSVLENITCALVNVLGQSDKEALEKATSFLDLVNLKDKLNSYPFELSGGQKQRVAIARAIAISPKILCFDEPTSALDLESIEDIINIMYKLKENGMTILIITHDLDFANKISDKSITIKNGLVDNLAIL